MKSLGIVITATGSDLYTNLACDLINSLRHNFPAHEVICFSKNRLLNSIHIPHEDLGWPRASLMRYHHMLQQSELLSQYQYLLYMDADMLPVTRVMMEELTTPDLIAVVHPGYPPNAFDTNPMSTACVPNGGVYYQGCLQGGTSQAYLYACAIIASNIDLDDANGVKACNYDESHWNRYLMDHPPGRVLGPAFAFPGAKYIRNDISWPKMKGVQPRIRHIDKNLGESRVW